MRAGLNGNYHSEHVFDLAGGLAQLGVTYNGDGDFDLPANASINATGGDDWLLTLSDGSQWHVWTED